MAKKKFFFKIIFLTLLFYFFLGCTKPQQMDNSGTAVTVETKVPELQPEQLIISKIKTLIQPEQPIIGKIKTLVILLDFRNNSEENKYAKEELDDIIFGTNNLSVNDFIKENSYGKAWLEGETLGWYHSNELPLKNDSPENETDLLENVPELNLQEIARRAVELSDDDTDFSLYNGGTIIVYSLLPDVDLSGSSYGFSKPFSFSTSEGTISAKVLIIITRTPRYENGLFLVRLISHEIGHTFKLPHPFVYLCEEKARDRNNGYCEIKVEFRNCYDVIGRCERVGGGHYNAVFKEKLGWLETSNVVVEKNGVYKIKPLELQSTEPQYLKIKANSFSFEHSFPFEYLLEELLGINHYYYLEYRRPVGFDSVLSERLDLDGILINTDMRGGTLVDIHPELSEVEKISLKNYVLHVGETFTDKMNDFTVTVLDISDSEATVKVEFME